MEDPKEKGMSFQKALKILGIEKYAKRIFSSNSHGELFHLTQYFQMAEIIGESEWFPEWFEMVVKDAEENWKRPSSVFQHIFTILAEESKSLKEERLNYDE